MADDRIKLVIYDKKETQFISYGLAVLDQATEITVKTRLNAEYTLSFRVPIDNDRSETVRVGNFAKLEGQIFIIRKVSRKRDQDGTVYLDASCEHVFFDLIERQIGYLDYQNVTIAQIVSDLSTTTRVKGNGVAISGAYSFTFQNITVLEALNNIIEATGAEIQMDNFSYSLLPQVGRDNGVRFQYRKNLTAIEHETNDEGTITHLYVLGKDDIKIGPIISTYWKEGDAIRDGLVSYSDVEDVTELEALGRQYLKTVEQPQVSYSIDVIELKKLVGYDDSESFGLGDTITIIDTVLGISVRARIVEYEYKPLEPNGSRVTLANFLPSLSATLADLQNTKKTVDQVTYQGKIRTDKLEGQINLLQNMVIASGAYSNAQVIDGQGILLENTDINSPDYGALYLGPGLLAIANKKNSQGWQFRAFGTGKGFTADEITTGVLDTSLVQIQNADGTTYMDATGITTTKADQSVRALMNNTRGFAIQAKKNGIWQDRFYADSDGKVVMDTAWLKNIRIVGDTNDILLDGTTRTLNLSGFTTIAGTIKAQNIDTTNLTVQAANITGRITANQIDSRGLTADRVSAGAIDGLTITGATVRTNSVGRRVVMDTTGLRSYDAGNIARIEIADTGSYGYYELAFRGQSGSKEGQISGTNGQLNMYASGSLVIGAGSTTYFSSPVIDFQNATIRNFTGAVAVFG